MTAIPANILFVLMSRSKSALHTSAVRIYFHFPLPWSVEDIDAAFVVKDKQCGQLVTTEHRLKGDRNAYEEI
jgi:hypothetical protein